MSDFIDTADTADERAAQRRRRRRQRDASPEQVAMHGEEISLTDFLQTLNEVDTLASTIIKDPSRNKTHVLTVISRQSATAKRLLDYAEKNENIRVDGMQAIELLRFMSDIFDNKFVAINA